MDSLPTCTEIFNAAYDNFAVPDSLFVHPEGEKAYDSYLYASSILQVHFKRSHVDRVQPN